MNAHTLDIYRLNLFATAVACHATVLERLMFERLDSRPGPPHKERAR